MLKDTQRHAVGVAACREGRVSVVILSGCWNVLDALWRFPEGEKKKRNLGI